MAAPQMIPLPPDLHLWAGCIVRVTTIDATTGNLVPNAQAIATSIEVQNVGGGAAEELQSGPFMLVPGPGATV